MIARLTLAIGLTAALTALGGSYGFAIGAGLAMAILTAKEPTPSQQRNALRGVVGFAILRRFLR